MRTSVLSLLDDAQKKMSGYAALYNYRLHNLSIKAEPEALLGVTVILEGEELYIENVADACNADGRDDQFAIYPKDREALIPIVQGIKKTHPEYDLDIKNVDDNEEEEEELKQKYILATMPVVDDNRHDVLTEGVKILSEVVKKQLEMTLAQYTAEITLKLANAPAKELDEAKDALQQLHDKCEELIQGYCDAKTQEIEEAYAVWQAAQAEKEAGLQEEAQNAMAGLKMKLNPEEDE